jgi:hypothetical protein
MLSTPIKPIESSDNSSNFLPSPSYLDGKATHSTYAAIKPLPERTGRISTDQTRQFPVIFSTGMCYVLVLYDFDSNAILAESLHNHTSPEIHWAYKRLHQLLIDHGLRPRLQ